ncbi:MAG TPA: hypothetical protein VHZ03_22650 [Trebonia sp.]|jgi:hypothetical protein|nr:hypothetical protein [Trebonia sp.]
MEDLVDAVGAQRGVRLDMSATYNDKSRFVEGAEEDADAMDATATPEAEANARELLGETIIARESTWDGQLCTMYLSAQPGMGTCSLDMVADTAYLPPRTMEALCAASRRS